jgi:soluble lytic murein transglycosylase-like protein
LKLASLILLSLPAFAGETIVLASGSTLRVDRHEVRGAVVCLFLGTGEIEVSAVSVAEIVVDPPTPAQIEQPKLEQPRIPAPAAVTQPLPDRSPKALVRQAAEKNGLPPAFVESVARVESGLKVDAVSPKGAVGVMQLMPSTAAALHADPTDPEQNIAAGAALLRDLLSKYDGDVIKALSAYNAGPGAVDRYRGVPPYAETHQYVRKVIADYQRSSDH